jgi:RHS repeat-associated protein
VTETYSAAGDGYNAHGGMLRLPHLRAMRWDFKDQLRMTRRQATGGSDEEGLEHQGERTWYVYDAAGQRARKVTVLASGELKDERIYLGGFEIYRRHSGAAAGLVRESLHVMEGKRRVALVETRVAGSETGVPAQLIRYQFGNRVGSASLELDEGARVISYEEYAPFGSTTYQAASGLTEAPKRYRFTGKERDEESGFYYSVARYYAPWLGRWTAADPAGLVDGDDLYRYARDNPVSFTDPGGTEAGGGGHRAEYRIPFDNPVTDPETHASYFNLMVGGLGRGLEAANLRSHWSLRLTEFLVSGALLYGPMVLSHELGGHVGSGQHYGLEARVTDFRWFTGMSRTEGDRTREQDLAIHGAGVNQQSRNAEELYRRMARFGFGPQDAIAYCLNQGGLTAYSLITIASSHPSSSNDIANYTAGSWTWSPRDLFVAGALTMIPSITTLLYTMVNFVGFNERRFQLPSVGIGGARLLYPQTQLLLTSQGPVVGVRSMLRLGGRRPDLELTMDVRPTGDAAVALGVRAHGINIPGVPWLELGASARVTIGDPAGFQGSVEATARPGPTSPLGINLSIGGGTRGDLLAEPERRSGFQLGIGLELRF